MRCQRLNIDGVYIYTSLKEAVWADGIDPDGCKDVHISNSTIETGDDAIVFYSVDDLWAAAALREHHGHELPSLFGVGRAEVLRLQRELHPQRDGGQLRDHRLEPGHRLHGWSREATSKTSSCRISW